MQLFNVNLNNTESRYLLSSTCADGCLYMNEIGNAENLEENSVKISKKRKISEVDKSKEAKKMFFADLE